MRKKLTLLEIYQTVNKILESMLFYRSTRAFIKKHNTYYIMCIKDTSYSGERIHINNNNAVMMIHESENIS